MIEDELKRRWFWNILTDSERECSFIGPFTHAWQRISLNQESTQIFWSILRVSVVSTTHSQTHDRGLVQTRIVLGYFDRCSECVQFHGVIHEHMAEHQFGRNSYSLILLASESGYSLIESFRNAWQKMTSNEDIFRIFWPILRVSGVSLAHLWAHDRGSVRRKVQCTYCDRFWERLQFHRLIHQTPAKGSARITIVARYLDRFLEWVQFHRLIHDHTMDEQFETKYCSDILINHGSEWRFIGSSRTHDRRPVRTKVVIRYFNRCWQ